MYPVWVVGSKPIHTVPGRRQAADPGPSGAGPPLPAKVTVHVDCSVKEPSGGDQAEPAAGLNAGKDPGERRSASSL
jgi:hypothetical protein